MFYVMFFVIEVGTRDPASLIGSRLSGCD